MQEDIDRLTAENFKLSRAILLMKRQLILLTAEKDERDKVVNRLENRYNRNNKDFKNIKEMQNDIAYQNSVMVNKFRKLEDLVLRLTPPESLNLENEKPKV